MKRAEYDRRVAKLKANYAYLFTGKHLEHDVLPGWLSIVEALCARIDGTLSEQEKALVKFVQIKEKLGGLRAYVNVAPVRVDIIAEDGSVLSGRSRKPRNPDLFIRLDPLIREAEERSFKTCCFCGAPGSLRTDRDWLLVLCDKHLHASYRDLDRRFEELTTP
jgi:hypothetical protein